MPLSSRGLPGMMAADGKPHHEDGMRSHLIVKTATALLLCGGGATLAQTRRPAPRPPAAATQPATRPATTPARMKSADEMLGELLRPPPTAAEEAADAGEGGNTLPPAGLREGTYVRDVVGKVVRQGDGKDAEFVVDGRAGGPALVLMPSLTLMMMEDAAANTGREIKFRVSGVVTEYRGKNYLLPEQVSRGGRPLQGPPPAADDRTGGRAAVKPNAPVVTVMREGTPLVDRTGRLTRSADGTRGEFTFDADRRTLRDPPVIVLPGLKLSAMENAQTGPNRDPQFRVTGIVTEYRGRNYLLPEKVVVVPDTIRPF